MNTFFAPTTGLDITIRRVINSATGITFVGAGAPSSSVDALSALALPVGRQSGDLLLLLVQNDNMNSASADNPSNTAYAGWTFVSRQPTTSSGVTSARITVYRAWSQDIVTGPEIADTEDHQSAVIVAYRGVNPTNPINAIAGGLQNTAATPVSLTGVTSTVNNCRILYLMTNNSDAVGTDWVSITTTTLTDFQYTHAQRFNQKWNAGGGGGLAVMDGLLTTAGASGSISGTQNSVNNYRWVTLALEPI